MADDTPRPDHLTHSIVGATGRTGLHVARLAVQRGHRVRGLVRTPVKAAALPALVEQVRGDATDEAALRILVEGADVVLDVSGPVRGGQDGYRRASTSALLRALAGTDARLIHLTGAGVRQPGDRPGVPDRLVRGLLRVLAGKLLADSTAAVDLVGASDVPVLVVRGPRLTDKGETGSYTQAAAVGRGSGIQVARADLAAALVDLAESADWPQGSPVISA